MQPERFFLQVLPRRMLDHLRFYLTLSGSISFAIADEGAWTVELGEIDSPITEGFMDEAELRLWFSREAFDELMDGTLDVRARVACHDVYAVGKVELLEKLGRLLAPPANLLSVRMGEAAL